MLSCCENLMYWPLWVLTHQKTSSFAPNCQSSNSHGVSTILKNIPFLFCLFLLQDVWAFPKLLSCLYPRSVCFAQLVTIYSVAIRRKFITGGLRLTWRASLWVSVHVTFHHFTMHTIVTRWVHSNYMTRSLSILVICSNQLILLIIFSLSRSITKSRGQNYH